MPAYPLRALVLRKTKLGETDLIVTLLAQDGREVRAVAKSARKPGSRFGARVEPFSVLDLLLHTGRSLDIITEAETVESHGGLRADYDRMMVASVVVDVLDKIAVEGQTEQRLFDLALMTLDVMESARIEALQPLLLAFLLKALSMQGYRPILESCAECGGTLMGQLRFSPASGGVVCERCGAMAGASWLGEDARLLMRTLLGARMVEVADLEVPEPVQRDVLDVLRGYVGFHLPARLRAFDYFAAGR